MKYRKYQAKLSGLYCSFCINSIKSALSKLKGVKKVHVNLSHEEVLVEYDPKEIERQNIDDILRKLGYQILDPRRTMAYKEQELLLKKEKKRLYYSAILTGIASSLMVLMWLGIRHELFPYIMMSLALIMVFGPGGYIVKMAFNSLQRGILNQHVLLELAAFSGLVGGFIGFTHSGFPVADFFGVSVFVTAYHILSGYLSLYVKTRGSEAVRRLLELQPEEARVIRGDKEISVLVDDVKPGDVVVVRPGERIPIDGVVLEGDTTVDESLATGESVPIDKKKGDYVLSGSVNISGLIKIKTLKAGNDCFVRRVAKFVEEAKALKPSILQVVDKILRYYVQGVILAALLGFLIWSFGNLVLYGEADLSKAVFVTLAVLVIGYPCALGMATPLAVIRGCGSAAERGILIRSGEVFQIFKDIKYAVLDKTGTLTLGKIKVAEIAPTSDYPRELVLKYAASVEKYSNHPIAKAIVEQAEMEGIKLEDVSDFKNLPGKGAEGRVDGNHIIVGRLDFLKARNVNITREIEDSARNLERKGETVIGVAINGNIAGLIGLCDKIKDDAKYTIDELKKIGIRPILMTGDSPTLAEIIASELGIVEFHARVMPDQKAEKIRELQRNGKVLMVGDGINDAPGLMQADIGIAVSTGTDIAIDSSDAVIVSNKLSRVIDAYHISKSAYQKTLQNLALAFIFNGVGIPAAIAGLLHPVWAMVAMVASVSTILLNSFGGRLVPRKRAASYIVVKIPSMHCEICATKIAHKILKVSGVLRANFNTRRKLLEVEYDASKISGESIVTEIRKLGHEVAIVKT